MGVGKKQQGLRSIMDGFQADPLKGRLVANTHAQNHITEAEGVGLPLIARLKPGVLLYWYQED
ncbi:hypothetical protein OFB74_34845, partial [Escherichia coli]|nr:hypothetical protein [Escherichia coli]